MNKSLLIENFGLTETEVNIFLSLLEMSESTASEIAHRNSLNRTFTYDRIDKLVKKGLVSFFIKDDKKYFKAADPHNLVAILKENQEKIISELESKRIDIENLVPSLLKLRKPKDEMPHVELYSTKRGIKSVLNLILKDKKELYIYGSLEKFQEIMTHYYEIWNKQRIKNKIKTKILTPDNVEIDNTEIDYLSKEHKTNTTTFTFGNKTVVILWSAVPVAILTESKEVAKSNIHFFNGLWDRDVKIYSGINGIRQAYWELISGDVKEFRGYGYSKILADVYSKKFSDSWHKKRIKKGIDNKIISFDDNASIDYFKPRASKVKLFEVRFLPEELQGPVCVTFSDYVVVTFIYTEKEFKVIINKDQETINTYKTHFEKLWKKSKNL
nr:hypothetical protein [Candidatus Woesearchaeota archaeon]